VNDDLIQQELFRNLQVVRSAESVFSRLNAAETLRRPESFIDIAADKATALASEQIHQQRRSSVVVIGMLHPDGMISQGTGFVINSTGIIVTNFHVVHKPDAVAAGVLLSDHRFFEVTEFLAGNPSDDLALLRIEAVDLPAIPLASGNASVGAELMAITHPDSHYFSMTFGRTTRYFQTTRHAVPSLRMGVTADFSEGSSGGPLLDMFGNVVGVVSATGGNVSQMAHREAIPISSLRRLTGNTADPKHTLVEPAVSVNSSGK
jgi:serine protease Do